MTVMQSAEHLGLILSRHGMSREGVARHLNAIVTHASVCRTRADSPPGAFRDFVRAASRMTRRDKRLVAMVSPEDCYDGEPEAACEALHDLIMEGV